MRSVIIGKAYVLGDNIDTDQIIPAQYLTFNPPSRTNTSCSASTPSPACRRPRPACPRDTSRFTRDDEFMIALPDRRRRQELRLRLARASTRPIALAAAGIEAVVAEFYARIFFRNCVNGGYLIPLETEQRLCDRVCTGDEVEIDVAGGRWRTTPPASLGVEAARRSGPDHRGRRAVPVREEGGHAQITASRPTSVAARLLKKS